MLQPDHGCNYDKGKDGPSNVTFWITWIVSIVFMVMYNILTGRGHNVLPSVVGNCKQVVASSSDVDITVAGKAQFENDRNVGNY